MLSKAIILKTLEENSSFNKALTSNYFYYEGLREGVFTYEISLKTFRRKFAQAISELKWEEGEKIKKGLPGKIILTKGSGYYIPKTAEEFKQGRNFYLSKAKSMMDTVKLYDEIQKIIFTNQGGLFQ